MNKYKRLLAAASAGIFAFAQCQVPVWAANDEVTKEENVFAILNGDGSVKEVTVSDWLNSENGFKDYYDLSNLENVVNLKGDEKPEAKDQGYIWNSESQDLYYQGTSDQPLPFELAISYTLDGKEMTMQELLGKSGQLKMTIRVSAKEKQKINGRELYVPMAVAALVDLDSSHFKEIEIEHGLMKTDDKNQIAASIFFPGLLENYEGVLDGYLGELKDEMSDEMIISCEVTDFIIPQIMGGAAGSLEELTKMSISDDFSGLMSSLDQLQEATDQLLSGTEALQEAAGTFDTKMGELNNQFTAYQAGIENAYQGTKDLNSGMNTLNQAMQALKGELDQSLLPGLASSSQKQQALQAQMTALQEKLAALGLDDIDGLTAQLQTALQEAMTNMFKAGLDTGIAAATSGQYQSSEAYLGAMSQEDPQKAQTAMAIINGGSEQATAAAQQGIQEIFSQLPLADLAALQDDLTSLTGLASEMMSDLNVLLGKVYDVNDDPANPQTLYGSILAMSVGIDQIDSGSQALLGGMDAINTATKTIANALSMFKEGSSALKDGTDTLNDGMQTYADEGISQLTNNSALDQLQTAMSIQEDMQNIALKTYSGASEGTTTSVHYVFKVDDTTEKKTDASQAEVNETEKETSLWDRLVGLFQ